MERRWVFVLLDVLCVLVASLPFTILTFVNAPYKRGFYCGDDSIRYPYRPDTITHGLMAGVIITATVILLYVQARLCWKWARLLRPTVQFFLVAFALYVGYTRVSDHKHHWSDVLVGLLQGALVASLTVRYISDFFKVRPPQHSPEEEELERKPSLSLTLTLGEADHNHYGYPVSSS
uniref:Phosphatidic acid phosphatase type 2C isoform 2 n=2 Tax=Sus scrofa TaxID=9823 RepID=B8XSI8_PIG|nr:phosphatidic acid phosphatase type 2C isoform 2 [Sus scrofa]